MQIFCEKKNKIMKTKIFYLNQGSTLHLILCLLIIITNSALGQDESFYGDYDSLLITNPSANDPAQNFDADVDLASGSVQQSVPIYAMAFSNFKWPVSLEYHFSGLKVDDPKSMIGLGWSLNATAQISREVRGLPDEHPYGYWGGDIEREVVLNRFLSLPDVYINESSKSGGDEERKLLKERQAYLFAQGQWDSELDVFNLSVRGTSVSFKLGKNLTPILLSPNANVKIDFSWEQILVTDDQGIVYNFSTKEHYAPKDHYAEVLGQPYTKPENLFGGYTNSWYLTSVTLPTSDEQLFFEYEMYTLNELRFTSKFYSSKATHPEYMGTFGTQIELNDPNDNPIETELHPDYSIYPYTRMHIEITKPVLSSISSLSGRVEFNSAWEADYQYPKITDIQIKDYLENNVQAFNFDQTFNKRLFLDHISVNGVLYRDFEYFNSSSVPPYRFYYNPDVVYEPGERYNDEDYFIPEVSQGINTDNWGYYNRLPNFLESTDYNASKLGGLKIVTLPTGGSVQYNYEPHYVKQFFTPESQIEVRQIFDSRYKDQTITETIIINDSIRATFNVSIDTYFEGHASVAFRKIDRPWPVGNAFFSCSDTEAGFSIDFTNLNDVTGDQNQSISLTIESDCGVGTSSYPAISNDNKNISLTPGTYSVQITTNSDALAIFRMDYFQDLEESPAQLVNEANFGGIRVKDITQFLGDSLTSVKRYYYNDKNGFSSASLVNPYQMPIINHEVEDGMIVETINAAGRNQGIPIFYKQVTEVENPAYVNINAPFKTQTAQQKVPPQIIIEEDGEDSPEDTDDAIFELVPRYGYSTYYFESPHTFKRYRENNSSNFYHEPSFGKDRSGVQLVKAEQYKESQHIDFDSTQILSRKIYNYEKVMLPTDINEQSIDMEYPKSLKVSSSLRKNLFKLYGPYEPQPGTSDVSFAHLWAYYNEAYYNHNVLRTELSQKARSFLNYATDEVGGSLLLQTSVNRSLTGNVRQINNTLVENYGNSRSGKYVITEYKEVDVVYRQNRIFTEQYLEGPAPLESDQETFYNDNHDVEKRTNVTSNGELTVMHYTYPYNYVGLLGEENPYDLLVEQNRKSVPVKVTTLINDKVISEQKVDYAIFDGKFLPSVIKTYKNNQEDIIREILRYDSYGHPIEIRDNQGTVIIQLWGYNQTVPIINIVNATYDDLPAELFALIDQTVSLSNSENSKADEQLLITRFQQIRDHLSLRHSQVTTYTYDPLIGMTSQTDPRGYTMYYEYDALNRLEYVKDADGNILSENKYNYRAND